MTDNELDTAIDDVAKAMTSAPHDVQLARRVAMRIADLDAPRARAGWLRPWILVPAAGLAVLLVAVFVARENKVPGKTVRIKPDTTKIHANAAAPATGNAVTKPGGPERVVLRPTPNVLALAPALAINLAPIDVERLEVAPMALSRIDISPIAIDRIEISAMP